MRSLTIALISLAVSVEAQERVRIFAAASLTDALGEAVERFEDSHADVRVVLQFGGSSDLARQIVAGAPADLFFSADVRQMDRLAARELLAPGMHANVLSNRLVVVQERSRTDSVVSPQDLEAFERVALADPEAVPAGVYARQFLEARGLWPRIRARVVPMLDVRGALAAVASGNVDAGIVYRTDAAIESRVKVVYEVPDADGPEIRYPLAIVSGRGGPSARALYEFLRSPEAGEVFASYGFLLVGSTP